MNATVIGIGAQKCASSWLHAVLAAHPEVGVAPLKELDFFSYYYDRGYCWYERLFESVAGKSVRFENSPSYFHDPRAPWRARDYDPELKVVLILRDPVARAFSNHLHEIIKGHIASISFEEGLGNNPSYREQSRYGTHLSAWLAAFPPEQVFVLLSEEIAADPRVQTRRLYAFLDIDPDFETGLFDERRNESDRARSQCLRTLLRAQGDRMRRLGLEEQLIRIKQFGPVRRLLTLNKIEVRSEIPPMREETRAMLAAEFADEMRWVARLIGRDSMPWMSWPDTPASGRAEAPAPIRSNAAALGTPI